MTTTDLPAWLAADRGRDDMFRRGRDETGVGWSAHSHPNERYWWAEVAPHHIRCECGGSRFKLDFGVMNGVRAICVDCTRVHLVTVDRVRGS